MQLKTSGKETPDLEKRGSSTEDDDGWADGRAEGRIDDDRGRAGRRAGGQSRSSGYLYGGIKDCPL